MKKTASTIKARAAGSSAPACSTQIATEQGIHSVRRLCEEALDHGMGWATFCDMVQRRLEIESVFVRIARESNKSSSFGAEAP